MRTLSAGERQGVRLRVVLETGVTARYAAARPGVFPVWFNANRNGGKREFLDLVGDDQYKASPDDYGQRLSERVPNRLKAGDLPASVLGQAVVSLVPAPSSTSGGDAKPLPLSLGELVRRIGEASGRELYADKRIAGLPVATRGASAAPAGDVLKALCLSVAGALRRVGPAYVLTSDVAGLAARRAVLDQWLLDAAEQRRTQMDGLRARMARLDPARFLSFPDDDQMALSSDLLARTLADQRARRGRARDPQAGLGLEVPLSALSPTQQNALAGAADRLAQTNNGEFAVTTDRVWLSVSAWLAFVIPGAGEIVNAPLDIGLGVAPPSGDAAAPAVPAPDFVLPDRRPVVIVSVASADEAEQAVRAAASHHLVELWLALSNDPASAAGADAPIVEAAVRAGKTAGVSVGAVVCLLTRPAAPNDPGRLDRNVLGQTASAYAAARRRRATGAAKNADETAPEPLAQDWLAPDAPGVADALRERLARLVRVPGLAGLVLRDALPPGYRSRKANPDNGNPPFRNAGTAVQLGYTPDQRLAFLRERGADPADIVPYFFFGKPVPRFPEASNGDPLAGEWAAWRQDRAAALLRGVGAALHQARPDLPVFLRAQAARLVSDDQAEARTDAWYVRWNKPGDPAAPLPLLYRNFVDAKRPLAVQARETQSPAAAPAAVAPPRLAVENVIGSSDGMQNHRASAETPFAQIRDAVARAGQGWNGWVLDLSDRPLAQALATLDTVVPTFATVPER